MRVCYLIPMLDYSTGWGRWTVDLLEQIPQFGIDPVLIFPQSQKEFHRDVGLNRFESYFWGPEPYQYFHTLRYVNFHGIWDLFALKRNFYSIRNISLIHAADLYPWGVFGLQLKNRTHVPLLLTNHSKPRFNPRRSIGDYLLCRHLMKRCDKICSVSEWSSGEIRSLYPRISDDKLATIYNGVNVERLDEEKRSIGTDMKRGRTFPVLLSVTRFIGLKSIETSILAFAKVKREFPEAVFYIVGPHTELSYVDEVKTLIRKNQLQDIHLLGKVVSISELCMHYLRADVLVHTSSSESFGLIFLEAGHFGLPVVATRVGGVPEVVTDGVNGLLVNDGDHNGVADAVKRILTDRALAARLGIGGVEKAAKHTTRKVAEEYADLYKEIVMMKN